MARPTKMSTLESTLQLLKRYGVHKCKLADGMEIEFRLPGFDAALPQLTVADLKDDVVRKEAIRESMDQAKTHAKEYEDVLYHSA
jgi:hypothetical protein